MKTQNKPFFTGILLLIGILAAFLIPFTAATGAVTIAPNPALTNDTLSCNVASGEGYIYQWYQNDQVSVTTQTVDPSYTSKNDVWRCVVKKYRGPMVGTITIGEDSMTISNAAPQWNGILGAINWPEDSVASLNLSEWFSDIDNDVLTYSNTAVQNITITINQTDGNAVFTPDPDWFGERTVQFTATDPEGLFGTSNLIDLNVTNVNDAPLFNGPIGGLIWDEDTNNTYNVSQHFNDVDGDVLTFTATPTTNITVTINQTTGIATFTPDANWNGVETVQIIATDPSLETAISNVFSLNVTPVNDAPVIVPFPVISFNEDSFNDTLDLDDYATDIENDAITWTFSGNNSVHPEILAGNIVNFTADADWNGNENITFTANDSMNTTSENLTVVVLPVNDAPNLTSAIPDQTWDEDNDLTLNLSQYFSDVDGDILTFTNLTAPENITLTFSGENVTLTPLGEWSGNTSLQLQASDGLLTADSNVFNLTVNSINDAPNLTSAIPDITFDEDSFNDTLNLSDYFSDVDSPVLIFSSGINDNNITISINQSTGIANFTAAPNWSGSTVATFIANDSELTAISNPVTVTVNPVNDPLAWNTQLPNQTLEEDFASTLLTNLSSYISDVDNSSFIFSVVQENTSEVDCEASGDNLTVASVQDWNGMASCTIEASDGEFTENSTFTINVSAVNDAPVWDTPIADQNVDEDSGIAIVDANLSASVSDVENDAITFTIENENTSEVDCNMAGIPAIQLEITPSANYSGLASCTVRASDGTDFTDTTFNITINPQNDAPYQTSAIPDQAWDTNTNKTINLTNYFADVDNSSLIFYADAVENITVAINQTTGIATLTPETGFEGTRYVTFTAGDGEFNVSSNNITLTVLPSSNVIDSWINSIWFAGTNYSDFSWAGIRLSNISASNITNSNINSSRVTNSSVNISTFRNATVTDAFSTNCTIIDSTYALGTCVDTYIDPSTIINSNVTGSTIKNSTVIDSNATYSNLTFANVSDSYINNSAMNQTNVTNSTIENSIFTDTTITDSIWIENLTANNTIIENSTVIDANLSDTNITNATLENVTINNSEIINSSLDNTEVQDANITNDVIYNGTIEMSNGTVYNATQDGQQNLTQLINSAPWISIISPANDSSHLVNNAITFQSIGNDVNVGTLLNDNLTYSWDFGNGNDSNWTNDSNTTYTYPATGTFTVTVTVNDSYNESDSASIVITIASSGGGGGGGDGTHRNDTVINATNITIPQLNISEKILNQSICQEIWQCNDWTPCINQSQSRTCSDKNACGTSYNKPSISRACEVEKKETGAFRFITGNAIFDNAANSTLEFIKNIPAYLAGALYSAFNFFLNLIRALLEASKLIA